MTITDEMRDFIVRHREHGRLVGHASEPAVNGYVVTVPCPCGVTFERWITPLDVADEWVLEVQWN